MSDPFLVETITDMDITDVLNPFLVETITDLDITDVLNLTTCV